MDVITCLARSYLKSIATKSEFDSLLEKLLLTDNEINVLRGVYTKHKNLNIVADNLGYSVQNIKVIHKSALMKIGNYIVSSLPK